MWKKININEIAKLAGVSRATVSRYLNNGYVSEEKRNIIAKVIEDTGYIPSAQARILRTKKSKLIGVIIPKLDSQSISREILGINEALSKEGYQILDSSQSVYDVMAEHNLIIGSGHSSIIFEAAFSGIPVVSLLDGVFPDEEYIKSLSGIKGIYPLHPEQLLEFIKDINTRHILLESGPDILMPFDFERVYKYLTEFPEN